MALSDPPSAPQIALPADRPPPESGVAPAGGSPRADLWVALALAVLGLAVRLAYLYQIRSLPLLHYLISDARAYADWAAQISAGDWLSRGQGVFYQAPLYPYFLALMRFLFGPDLWPVRLLQAGLGAASGVLVFLAGRRWLGRAEGLAAGTLVALYPPAIFFDGLIHKESLGLFLMALLLWLVATGQVRREPAAGRLYATLGLVLGLLVLLRENALLLVPLIAVWCVRHELQPATERPRSQRWRSGLLFAAGLAAVLLPVMVRNLVVGGELVLTTAQAGPNFYIGNHEGASGSYQPLRPGRSDTPFERRDAELLAERAVGHQLSPGEVSRYWFHRAWDFIREQPGAWLGLLGTKTLMVLHAYEMPDAEDYYLYRRQAPLLRVLGYGLHFGVLLPLAAAGLVLTWGQRRQLWLLQAALLAITVGVVLFFVLARYRFPLVPLLALFAGAGLVRGYRRWRRHQVNHLRGAVIALVAASLLANLPIEHRWRQNPGMPYSNLGAALAGLGRVDEAVAQYRHALEQQPDLMEAHLNLGSALLYQHQPQQALVHLQRAAELAPEDAEAQRELAVALQQTGDVEGAVTHFRRALELHPGYAEAALELGSLLLASDRWPEAIAVLRDGTRRSPRHADLALKLAVALLAWNGRGPNDLDEAIHMSEVACQLTAWRDLSALRVLATAYAAAGRNSDVATTAQRALEVAQEQGNQALVRELMGVLQAYR